MRRNESFSFERMPLILTVVNVDLDEFILPSWGTGLMTLSDMTQFANVHVEPKNPKLF